MSLRTRLYLGLSFLVFGAVLSAGWLVLRIERAQSIAAFEARARQTCQALAAALPGDSPRLESQLSEWVERGLVKSATVVDAHGHAIAHAGESSSPLDALLLTAHGAPLVVKRGADLLIYISIAEPKRAVRFTLAEADEISATQRSAEWLLIAVTFVDAGLALLFGVLYLRRVIGPIEELSLRARKVASGKLDVPALRLPNRRDEIATLCEDFSRMTESLRSQHEHLVAQEKLVTVGRLAAGVAHEIGNPLAAILGYTDLLYGSSPKSEAAELLLRTRQQIERIQQIVSDLLLYARPVADAREPVSLAQAVAAALSLLTPQKRFAELAITVDVPSDLPSCQAQMARVVQVLVNLLLNAADAMSGRGTLRIAAKTVGNRLELSVHDSGPGVAESERARIFDPFYTTKEPGAGAGLGLSISRSIAQAFGGDLQLAAEAHKGARFVLSLPC